ncbi:hypothetical protein RRF57_003333 [Xylaria bambusicola]|uniref:Uncharacterized protein n=1 Tax=Xylaria bambusicola TaxID=326684 RepID=A0AAN7UGL3_9PEZI
MALSQTGIRKSISKYMIHGTDMVAGAAPYLSSTDSISGTSVAASRSGITKRAGLAAKVKARMKMKIERKSGHPVLFRAVR